MAASSLFLKKGDLRIGKNYRGITLTSIAASIYDALLLNRVESAIEKIRRKNYNGFRRNRPKISHILTIRRILESDHQSDFRKSSCKKTRGDTLI